MKNKIRSVSFPEKLWNTLMKIAKDNHRTTASEIVMRLEKSIKE